MAIQNGAPIAGASKAQKVVAQSTCEAEVIALADAVKETVYLRMLAEDLKIAQKNPTTIYEDNEGAIAVAESEFITKRCKHIRIKLGMLKSESTELNTIKLEPIASEENIADINTKALCEPTFVKLRDQFMSKVKPSILDEEDK